MCSHTLDSEMDWETLWAPYDEATYQAVLEQIRHNDIVLEIGAGDLRLARRMVEQCQKVYAIEIQGKLLDMPHIDEGGKNVGELVVIQGDARQLPFPPDITVGVLLMRHCTHFQLYTEKLARAGAERLITNARWHMDLEVVKLGVERISFKEFELGWYACWCGRVGFKPGRVESLIPEVINTIHEVIDCPECCDIQIQVNS